MAFVLCPSLSNNDNVESFVHPGRHRQFISYVQCPCFTSKLTFQFSYSTLLTKKIARILNSSQSYKSTATNLTVGNQNISEGSGVFGGSGGSQGGARGGGGGKGGEDDGGDEYFSSPDDPSSNPVNAVAASIGKHPELLSLTPTQLAAYLSVIRSSKIIEFLANNFSGFRSRTAADPQFFFKMIMEMVVGTALVGAGMVSARGKDILNELDFALCDILIGLALNFVIIWLLSPTLSTRSLPTIGNQSIQNKFNSYLKALPSNIFENGSYTLSQRIAAFFYKGGLFAVGGAAAAVIGSTMTRILIQLRKTLNPKGEYKKLPALFNLVLAWSFFMFASSNPRYQILNGIEYVLFAKLPETVAKIGSVSLRTGNNILGGSLWVLFSRAINLES